MSDVLRTGEGESVEQELIPEERLPLYVRLGEISRYVKASCEMVCIDGPRALRHSYTRPVPVGFFPVMDDARIEFPKEYLLRQGKNECAPYTLSSHLFGQTGTYVSPVDVLRKMRRMPNGYSYPHVYESMLREFGAPVVSDNISAFTDDQTFGYIQAHLKRQQPVSFVWWMHKQLHFSAAFGAWLKDREKATDDTEEGKRKMIDLYDPLHKPGLDGKTRKTNGDKRPGNRTIPFSVFMRKFRKGNFLGLYKGLAITGSLS